MSDEVKPSFQGEMMLAGWKEAHNSGAVVSFWLPDSESLDVFKGMTAKKGNTAGQRFMVVLVEIQDDETPARPAPCPASAARGILADEPMAAERIPNELARKMHVDGYFRNPKLWARMEAADVYTQETHKAWIEAQPCLFATTREVDQGPCSGDVVLHHCSSAAIPAAGEGKTPRKPPHWYGVPLCSIGHHQNWVHASHGANREAKQRLLETAVELTATRMKSFMKGWLGIESLRDITPSLLLEFEKLIEP